jgi:uncharacterized protein
MLSKKVAILGATDKEGRYARMAQELLVDYGYEVTPISDKAPSILGLPTVSELRGVPSDTDTLTIYVGSRNILPLAQAMIDSPIRRFIFNPGTECSESIALLRQANKVVLEACTLVMLKTGQFERI